MAFVLLAFGLRVYKLQTQSLWHDEALSVISADPNLLTVVGRIADVQHPPLHFWLLGLWMSIAGQSEFAVRFPSVIAGTALIPLVFAIGRRLRVRESVLVAGLAAISPFLVYYGQETRSYALLALTGAISAYAALRLLERPSIASLTAYVIASAALVYTHYTGLAMVAFEDLFFLVAVAHLWRTHGRPPRSQPSSETLAVHEARPDNQSGRSDVKKLAAFWMLGQVIVGLVFLPWALMNVRLVQSHASSSWQSFTTASFFWQTAITFPLGHSVERYNATVDDIGYLADHQLAMVLSIFFLGLVAFGSVCTVVHGRSTASRLAQRAAWGDFDRRWFAILWLLAPAIVVYILSLDKRDFTARYLIASTPAYYVLVVAGILLLRRLSRTTGAVLFIAVVGVSAFALWNYYGEVKYARDDYRSAAAFVQRHAQPNEGIILNAAYSYPAFDYYYQGSAARHGLPEGRPLDPNKTAATLRRLGSTHDYLWLVLWQDYFSDPERFVETSLDRDFIRTREETFHGNIKVRGYRTRSPIVSEPIDGIIAVGERLGQTAELAGYKAGAGRAGEEITVTLYWRALQALPDDNTVFLHLLDQTGALVAQADGPPVFGRLPTSKWPLGVVVEDERRLAIPAYTAPGDYSLNVGLYDARTMRRVGDGQVDRVVLPLHVDRDRTLSPVPSARTVQLGGAVRLIGFDAGATAKAGASVSVDLFWQAVTTAADDWKVFVHLLDSSGKLRAQHDAKPANGIYPASLWSREEIVRDRHSLALPPDLPAGDYTLSVGMYDALSGQRLSFRSWPWLRQESSVSLAKMVVTQ